jgi:hypothetical protein
MILRFFSIPANFPCISAHVVAVFKNQNRPAPSFWRRIDLFIASLWNWVREVFGIYTFEAEESASFNPTILPNYQRLRADFFRGCPPDKPDDCVAPKKSIGPVYKELAALISVLDQDEESITRSDLYRMESYLIAIADDGYLLQAYPGLQDRYRALAGADAYKRYSESKTRPDLTANQPDLDKVRADALFLIAELRRLAIAIPRRESIRKWLTLQVLAVCLSLGVILSCFLLYWHWSHFPYLIAVALFSLCGGVISVSRRLQSTPDEELNIAQWGRVSLILSPVTSMGFGIILYYIFAANLISGPLFPDVSEIELTCPLSYVAANSRPNDGKTDASPKSSSDASAKDADGHSASKDSKPTCISLPPEKPGITGWKTIEWIKTFDFGQFAKLIIWAFIAGFFEQLVPDTLDTLIQRQKSDSTKK